MKTFSIKIILKLCKLKNYKINEINWVRLRCLKIYVYTICLIKTYLASTSKRVLNNKKPRLIYGMYVNKLKK